MNRQNIACTESVTHKAESSLFGLGSAGTITVALAVGNAAASILIRRIDHDFHIVTASECEIRANELAAIYAELQSLAGWLVQGGYRHLA